MSGRYACIILDFDGTFTDVEREAVPFLARYREGLAALIGRDLDDAWGRAVAAVESDLDAHGFEFDGRIVAPSHADPYILATSVARLVLAEDGEGHDVDAALEQLFRDSYGCADTAFRPDADQVVQAVLEMDAPVYVVTNSNTEHVKKKIRALSGDALSRLRDVRGDAKKFHLVDPDAADPRFDAVPEALEVEGLSRPLFLRRGRYFETLRDIWTETGTEPAQTLVCGDIFELDLALPAQLGATVHLVTRPNTPAWERRAVERAGGTWSERLTGLLEHL
ncbi:MAG: HAD family hydrolase [Sandaracinaceae bacterium]|nr:MAG: HAD family hydrolase [Sandaracinaceae bacterium]